MARTRHSGLFNRRSGTVTVIEDRVHRSSIRKAKLAFWVTCPAVGLLAATVAADTWHPITALLVGALIGVAVGLVVAAVVAAWPVLRLIWWWTPETTAVFMAGLGWVQLAHHTTVTYRLVVVAAVVGVPAAVPRLRRYLVAVAWCVVSRHRLRTCFAQFIITNRTGSLPLILWAVPIPVGERVWVWLRPGLSLGDLEGRLDKIAAACWAATVTVERASESNAAFVRVDIKRRDALTATVISPLLELVDLSAPAIDHDPAAAPTALDLPDVASDQVTVASAALRGEKKTTRPAATAAEPTPAVTGSGGDDISDWID